jgi:protein-S-isoprenylcysteine O-methyltransferase Ste14
VVATPYVQQSHAASVVLSISVAAFVIGELFQAFRLRRGAGTADVFGEVVFRVIFFGGILMLALALSAVPAAVIPGHAVTFVVGIVVGWLGLLLRWWSFITLGRSFTTVVKASSDQVVIDRGPYRTLRHPSYTGLLLAVVGFGLMFGNSVGLLGSSALLLAAVVYRIRIEERALIATIGDAYRVFASGRARLVPFIW